MKRALVAAVLVGAAGLTAVGVAASAAEQVRICHWTGDRKTPYTVIRMSASGAYHAHYPHHSDIIPPFEYKGETYSRNWGPSGRAIWNNGCIPPEVAGGADDPDEDPPPQDRPNAVRGRPTFTG